ncbi:MAG: MiaB/RimO family radical SAM methylthiotransferase [Candidatus Shapirobacteria bacterium]|nr:MiaB/RimO family radical SAM methylthiotransferase [Candidatus Shapirobacteria bacterium]
MNNSKKTFLSVNFGCRVNMAETNQWSQTLIDQGLTPSKESPDIILVNTCAITKKGEKESINKIKFLSHQYPQAQIYVTGCADFDKIKNLPNTTLFKNNQKEDLLNHLKSLYTPEIKDKFSHTHRYLLKVQSGCTQFCSYCIVPFKRDYLWSLSINDAVNTVKQAANNNYKEVIITGVNLDQYQPGFSTLVETLLKKTNIQLISFGSIPINCIDKKFIELLKKYSSRIQNFLHIPIQSGSNKILSLMNRPYTKSDILEKFNKIKKIIPRPVKGGARGGFLFGTDIIVGFPNETDQDFQETLDLCQQIGFSKIHTFPFSPRPNTKARIIFENSPKISKEIIKSRSQQIRSIQV